MFEHRGLVTSDLSFSKSFFLTALAPLGFAVVMEGDFGVCIGREGKPSLWLSTGDLPASPLHLTFSARTRSEVDAFYKAALAAGGADHGCPGVRAHAHPDDYAAFVIGPDGHRIEAVCQGPED